MFENVFAVAVSETFNGSGFAVEVVVLPEPYNLRPVEVVLFNLIIRASFVAALSLLSETKRIRSVYV
jgi:hypothetical protein